MQRFFSVKIKISSCASKLLGLLLLTDLGFIAIHILLLLTGRLNPTSTSYAQLYSLERDRGFPEVFQYTKEFWCILLLGFTAIRQRSLSYLSWMLLFIYLLLDDSFHIHEQVGAYLSDTFRFIPMLGLRPVDFGELIVSGTAGLLLLGLISVAYRFGDRLFRKASRYLMILLLALATSGILFDMLHIVVPERMSRAFGVLEDGGEMLVMSVIVTSLLVLSEQVQPINKKTDRIV